MDFKQEIKRFFQILATCGILFFVVTCALCFVPCTFVTLSGHLILVPSISESAAPVPVHLFRHFKEHFLPVGYQLFSTSPFAGLAIQFEIASFVSFLMLLPYFFISLFSYLFPALSNSEKRRVLTIVTISTLLFLGGCAFAYAFVIQSLFSSLLIFSSHLGLVSSIGVDDFLSWAISASFLSGTLFLFPVVMFLLSALSLVPRNFWVTRWREVLVGFLLIASIVTPDTTGISVLIVMVPGVILYLLALIVIALAF